MCDKEKDEFVVYRPLSMSKKTLDNFKKDFISTHTPHSLLLGNVEESLKSKYVVSESFPNGFNFAKRCFLDKNILCSYTETFNKYIRKVLDYVENAENVSLVIELEDYMINGNIHIFNDKCEMRPNGRILYPYETNVEICVKSITPYFRSCFCVISLNTTQEKLNKLVHKYSVIHKKGKLNVIKLIHKWLPIAYIFKDGEYFTSETIKTKLDREYLSTILMPVVNRMS